MYILIILLCITILFRDKKEGFWKSASKRIRKALERAKKGRKNSVGEGKKGRKKSVGEGKNMCKNISPTYRGSS